MKAKKILSMLLTFSIIISCFAGLSIVSVSAHQNYSDAITFDEIDDFNVTGYKYGTGNFTRAEGDSLKYIEQYTNVGKFTCFNNNANTYVDVGTAPDSRYGKSFAVHHSQIKDTVYVQATYTPGGNTAKKLYNTVHMTASLYVPDASLQTQRALLFRTTENSGYRKYPVSFGYGASRDISIFGADSGKDYTTSKWYDFDIIYNIDTMEYNVKVWENDTLLIDRTGVDTGEKYSYIDSVILYHGPSAADRPEQVCYWDNLLVETTHEFNIITSGPSTSKEVWDFENFEKQVNGVTNVGMPASSRGTWSLGYQGSTALEIVKSVTDEKTEAMEVSPNLGKSVAFGNFIDYDTEETHADIKNDYIYPQFRFDFKSSAWSKKFRVVFSVRLVQNGALNLYMKGSNQCNIFMANGTGLYIFGVRDSSFNFNTADWFDVNILMDAATGYYSMDIKNRTSPSKPSYHREAFDPQIITAWARTDTIIYLQESTSAKVKYVYLDNVYWGEAFDSDFPETTAIPDAQAVATAEAEASATAYFPFADTGAGKFVTANLTFAGTAPVLNLGGEAIDVSTLAPGTYPVSLKLFNGEADTTTLTIDGTVYPVSLTTLPSSLVLTAPLGEGNSVSLTDIDYKTMDSFRITNNVSENLFDPDDDVTVTFSTKLVNPSADMVKVYKPSGSISENCEITEKTVTFAPDGKSVTIAFDKDYDTHYHIALEGLTDEFGSTLTDSVGIDTQLPDLIMSDIRFFRGAGENIEALSLLTPGEVKASMNITANNDTDFELFFALGLYEDDILVEIKTTSVEASSKKAEPVLSVNVPNDGKEYTVKAFAWRNLNNAPLFKVRSLKAETSEPIAIIKLDDFGTNSGIGIWQEVAQWANEKDVKMSFGLMGYAIEQTKCGKSHATAVANLAKDPMIEVWSHGYDWQTGHFTSTDEADQANEFAESNRVAEEAGFTMTAFNPPSNGMNATTVKVLNEQFPNYTTVMLMSSTKPAIDTGDNNFTVLWKRINCEAGSTSNTETVENLKARWNEQKANGAEYIVLQLHPQGWTSNRASQERFYEFVMWLKDQGVVFMNPSEYTAYINQ